MSVALAKPDNLIAFPQPQSKSNEWYTPSKYIEAARKVMGSIDLDPASCEMANRTVKAKRYYTKEDNGLAQEWKAKTVWLNPPYGKNDKRESNIRLFTQKLIGHYECGDIEQAILLSTSKTDTPYFIALWNYLICFTDHIVLFERDTPVKHRWNGKESHIHGTIFVYLGLNEPLFIDIFSQFGRIAKAIDTPKVQPVNLSLWEVQS